MSAQLQVTGEAKIRDIQGPVVANDGVITALDGAANQYVRGDGTLASFPTSGGGGSSVSYYLNGSVNQGTFGGSTYYQMSKDAITGTGTNFSTSSNGLLAQFITDANDPDVVSIPSGNWNVEFFMGVSASSGSLASFYVEIYKYDGSTFTLLATNVATPEQLTNTTTVDAYFTSVAMPLSAMALTDRLAVRIYANVASKTVTLYTEDNRLCQVITTFSKGILSINNLTDQSQNLTTGTSGTNFAIVSSGDTHTFNLPVASATNTGKLSSTDWTTFNNKQNALTNPITGTGAAGNVAYFDGTTSITSENSFNYDASTNRLGVNTTTPNATIGANAATDSGYSLLLKNDNANYNGIGFGTDSTYGNLIATEKLGTAPARNLTLINQSGFISLTEAGNLGVGLLTPNTGLDIYNGTSSYLWLHTANSGVGGTDGVRLALFSTNGANLRNFEGSFSITAEGDFSIITIGAENFRVNSADGSIYQSKVSNAMLKSVSGVITAAVAGTDYLAPSAISGTTNTIPKFTSSSALGNSNITDTGSLITLGSTSYVSSGNFGVGTSSPAVSGVGIDIYSATSAGLRFHTATSGTTVSDGAGINFSAANNLGISNYENGAIDIVTNGNSGVYIASNGYVGINGATPSVALTVNGAISQTSITSALLKTDSSGLLVAAVAGTDYVTPSTLSSYVPANRTLTINGTAYDLSADRSWSVGTITGSGTNGYIPFFNGSTTALGSSLLYNDTSNSRIGLGTTSPLEQFHIYNASAAASFLLQTNSSTAYSEISVRNASSVSTSYFRQYSSSASGTDFGASRANLATFFSNYASNFAIGTLNGGDLILGTANTERLRVLSSNGYVGIGTSNPSNILHIVATAPILAIESNTTGNVFLRMLQSGTVVSSLFYNNATSTLTLSNNNAGIQFNTSGLSNAFNLASTGAATFSSSVTATQFTINGVNDGTAIFAKRTGGANVFALNTNLDGSWTMYDYANGSSYTAGITQKSGNVGIGTSSPSRLLSLGSSYGASAGLSSNIKLALYDNGVSGDTYGLGISLGMLEIQSAENIGFYNGTGTTRTERMRINPSGRLLVGTTTDNGRGNIQTNDNISANNITTFSLTLQGLGTPVSTGLGINAYSGGRTYLLLTSQQWSDGNSTSSTVTMIRCGYNGNNFSAVVLASSNATNETWSQSGGILYVTGNTNFQLDITVLSNG